MNGNRFCRGWSTHSRRTSSTSLMPTLLLQRLLMLPLHLQVAVSCGCGLFNNSPCFQERFCQLHHITDFHSAIRGSLCICSCCQHLLPLESNLSTCVVSWASGSCGISSSCVRSTDVSPAESCSGAVKLGRILNASKKNIPGIVHEPVTQYHCSGVISGF